ncbi:MAG: DUF721 domain-containing protein [Prevotellaceae bacterium]|nr:DUF721 domain-containing protein [Prevotellaceae bacterium]MDD5992202.1 DUF721 domain-containing protein [Prevotellaceae bacterium]MDD6009771.1 DUF721 domain-containing protein [Prevotellaceae bacterium]MDD6111471.1 DUF721 domain-containing protein [Prevotellaceae bacterium]MDD6781262.1 DUF721 domain-containing protein [Prevotellaceae bacterium]
MFKRDVKSIKDIVLQSLRVNGLETPLLQKRIVDSWQEVVGEMISRYTLNVYIENQTLVVRMSSPALRQELSMRRDYYVELLNNKVGAKVIYNIRFC